MTDNVLLARHHTEVLLDMVAEGIFDPLDVLKAALRPRQHTDLG